MKWVYFPVSRLLLWAVLREGGFLQFSQISTLVTTY